MTTEYYQIPSQQGLLPLDHNSPDPWLASATSALSLSDNTWSVKGNNGKSRNPPSLFDINDVDAVSWKHIIPMQTNAGMTKAPQQQVKQAPKVPKGFTATSSKIDAWSVVDNVVNNKTDIKLNKRTSITSLTSLPALPSSSIQPSTEEEEDQPIEDELAVQNRYKTELCKSFNETGNCRYGTKCQFAHGKEEVRGILRHPKYKTETCKTFHTTGTCPYGIRCRFIHTRSKEESNHMITIVQPVVELEEDDEDDGVSLTHPPGIPVPQWSKSWNMSIASPTMQRKNFRVTDRLTQPEPAF